ncbi:HD domain-containing protein [Brevibacillus laterosporus]|uniref:HD domain-containing protein n=1 Tax=Brevibacillus laterosporus TaxID=1465 RepID=UPI002E1D374B|nr:HD domain-containing protein [Brevibacillus laterosporus]MED1667197.1 HD domain-containing protein [Brevibacillus laterosporus]MED1719735.1 HD domain-containing protein [Brevibacillus laterosporus]
MRTLEKAIVIATKAHADQVDKGGNPYILHPLRVMLKMSTEEEMIAAVLHDVIEDTKVNADDLKRAGFTESVIDAVIALTRQDGETYMDFIKRAKQNPIARTVKIRDIEDNCDLTRISNPSDQDHSRMKRYKKAIQELMSS